MAASGQTTLMDHIGELRRRLFWCAGAFIVGGLVGYLFRGQIISFLQAPLRQNLYYTSPAGSFNIVMQVCAVVGLILTLPLLIFHLLRFIEPALKRPLPRRLIATVTASSLLLALGGAAFAYYLSLPVALQFFNSVGTNHLEALISVDQYFRFVFMYLAAFALVFQLPLILLVIDRIFPMRPQKLRRGRKFVIIGAFGVALITPTAPDPLSQLILAVPIIVLYELSVLVIWLRYRVRHRRPAVSRVSAPVQLAAAPAPAPRPVLGNVLDLRGTYQEPAPSLPAMNILDLRGTYEEPAPSLPAMNILDLRIQK